MTPSSPSPSPSLPQAPDERFFEPSVGIEAMGSDESFRLILETMLESLAANLPEIHQALAKGDVPTANSILHAIKGYVPLMCTDRLVEMVTHIEGVSKTAGSEQVIPLYATLEPILQQLLIEIQAYIDKN